MDPQDRRPLEPFHPPLQTSKARGVGVALGSLSPPLLGKVVAGSVSGLVHRFIGQFVYDQDRNNRTVALLKVGGWLPSKIVLELVLNRNSLLPVHSLFHR
jgi:hypothetical protein